MGEDGRGRRLTPETWAWLTDSGVRRDESWGKGRSKHSGLGFSLIQHSKADLIKRLYGGKAFCYLVINCAAAQGQRSLVKTDLPQIIRHWRLPIVQIWILRCVFFFWIPNLLQQNVHQHAVLGSFFKNVAWQVPVKMTVMVKVSLFWMLLLAPFSFILVEKDGEKMWGKRKLL